MQRKKPAGQQRATGADFTGHPVARAPALPLASHSHVAQGGCGASDMTAWPAACLSVSWSVRVGWGCFALLIRAGAAALCARSRGEPSSARCGESWLVCGLPGWGGVASLCARARGEPSSAHCEQRLSERLTPCPCEPVCACTGIRGHARKGNSWQNDAAEAQKTPWTSSLLRTHTQRSEPCRDGGVGWGGWGPIWRAQGV